MSKKTATVLLWVLIAGAVISNIFWISENQSPPLWDIAGHSNRSAYFAQLLSQGEFKAVFNFNTIYPPFAYLVTALFFLIGGWSALIPSLSLLPFLILFVLATYSLANSLYRRRDLALAVAALALAYPLLAHFTRIYDLDFPQAALTTAAIAALLKTKRLTDRRWVIWSALAIALAILTKWTAVIFMVVPLVWELGAAVRNKVDWKKSLTNLGILGGLILALVLPWYIRHGRAIYDSSVATRNNVFSVPFENLWSWGNISFYAKQTSRAITWPLAIAFIAGLLILFWKQRKVAVYLLFAIGVPYLFLTFALYSKESRYFLPVFPLLAVITMSFLLLSRKIWRVVGGIGLALVAGLFWLQTSFAVPVINASAQKTLRLDDAYGFQKVMSEKPYFGFTFPTAYHKNLPEIIEGLKNDVAVNQPAGKTVKVAVVPNNIFLSGQPAEFYARLNGLNRPGGDWRLDFSYSSKVRGGDWREQIIQADYLITKTGDQGPPVWGPELKEVSVAEVSGDPIFTENFELLETWSLPGIEGKPTEARLYRSNNQSQITNFK